MHTKRFLLMNFGYIQTFNGYSCIDILLEMENNKVWIHLCSQKYQISTDSLCHLSLLIAKVLVEKCFTFRNPEQNIEVNLKKFKLGIKPFDVFPMKKKGWFYNSCFTKLCLNDSAVSI